MPSAAATESPAKKQQAIKYIVLSDLHLGEADSLFTPQNSGPAELFKHFSACLADLINVYEQDDLPVMLLNGDILGLSFSSYSEALGVLEHMIEAFTQDHRVCEKVAYLPGNHDQHIWQLVKETNYRCQLTERAGKGPLPELATLTSPIYGEGLPSELLQTFVKPGTILELQVFYPNLILRPPAPGDPAVLLHHGHFTESTYCFVSKAMHALYPELPLPKDLEHLTKENDAMINFVFSHLGRSGEAGKFFEKLMATLSSKELIETHGPDLANNLATAVDFPYIPFHFIEKKLSSTLIRNISESVRSERYNTGEVCSDKTMNNLRYYLDHFCAPVLSEQGCDDSELTFIWGHTHKPFLKKTDTEKLGSIRVLNSGGWVIPHNPMPVMGASVLLINEHNEVQPLRIFNDGTDGGTMHFQIGAAGGATTPFVETIKDYLYPKDGVLHPLWSRFRTKLTKEIKSRRKKHE